MKLAVLLALVGAVSAVVNPVQIYGAPEDNIEGGFIVKFTDERAFLKFSNQRLFKNHLDVWHFGDFMAVGGQFDEEELALFQFSEGVDYIQNNLQTYIVGEQINPPSWGIDRVDQRVLPLDNLYRWTDASNGQGVDVYVLDTGIFSAHESYNVGQARFGTDCSSLFFGCNQNTPGQDPNGHGSHCAGTIASPTHGVAKSANVVDVKVIGANGTGGLNGIINGIEFAVNENTGARKVISMSIGAAANAALNQAVDAAVAAGVVAVVAAGNENQDACNTSPASADSAIVAGATDIDDTRAVFSNFGTCVDLFAPGVSIVSHAPAPTGFNVFSGTSMACPHTAGAAACILSRGTAADQVEATLVAEATPGLIPNGGVGSPNLVLFTNPL